MYDPEFVPGCVIDLPNLGARIKDTAFLGGTPITHTRFSIIFNQARGLATVTAHNIDGASVIEEGEIPRKNRFRLDPDVPRHLQIDNDRGYVHNPWDRGHLVRRRSLHWRGLDEAKTADSESFFWTNIAPQHNRLHSSAWGNIENWMFEATDDADRQAAVFTGPVFTPEDPFITNKPGEQPIQIPAGFWKVIALKDQGELLAAAFLVWQRDFDKAEPVAFDPILEQVRLTTVEVLTGLSFPTVLQGADPLRFGAALEGAAFRFNASLTRSAAVTCPGDIVLRRSLAA